MKTQHKKLNESVNELIVSVTLIPENEDDKLLLKRAMSDQLDVSDSLISDHIVLYLEKQFPGFSVLSADHGKYPNELIATLKSTKGIG
jgi:hypothetical protein